MMGYVTSQSLEYMASPKDLWAFLYVYRNISLHYSRGFFDKMDNEEYSVIQLSYNEITNFTKNMFRKFQLF